MRLACNGDLPFLHHFQQCTLYLGWCAVNFIGQQQVGKHWPQHSAEFAGLLVKDACAHQVGGQQIGRELNAAETAVEGFGQSIHSQGFGQTRYTFNEQMPLR